jgi:hypothetical protein
MQPLTVILGIVLGSVFSVAFGLGIVWLIFDLRQGEDVRFASELPELARATVLFSMVTVVSALSFVGFLRAATWKWWPTWGVMLGLAGIGFYYWPA